MVNLTLELIALCQRVDELWLCGWLRNDIGKLLELSVTSGPGHTNRNTGHLSLLHKLGLKGVLLVEQGVLADEGSSAMVDGLNERSDVGFPISEVVLWKCYNVSDWLLGWMVDNISLASSIQNLESHSP